MNHSTLTFLASITIVNAAFGQGTGPLVPPGPPAGGVYRTLEQIEPRRDLATLAGDADAMHIISEPGSYYLSANLDVTKLNGIEIGSNAVTLDLNGFNIFRSDTAAASGTAIRITGANRNIHIKNGNITGSVNYDINAPGDQFTGAGFVRGIHAANSFGCFNSRVSNVHIVGCDLDAIELDDATTNTVEHCSVWRAGGIGIRAGAVSNCTAIVCGDTAIDAYGNVNNSRAESVGPSSDGITATGNVSDSYASTTGMNGIAARIVTASYGITTGTDDAADGIDASWSVSDCYGSSAGDDGIDCNGGVTNSYGTTTGSDDFANGIDANNVTNSSGAAADGIGVAAEIVSHCSGNSSSGTGLRGDQSVTGSYGFSALGFGITSSGSITGSQGFANSPGGNGTGISGRTVADSFGSSFSSHGIRATGNVSNSTGEHLGSTAGSDGINSDGSVFNSLGDGRDDGIDAAHTIGYSHGQGTSGDGLRCAIAVGCTSIGGQTIGDKYLMP